MKEPYIFELRVPVACTLMFGQCDQTSISCLPGDLVRFGIIQDDKSIYLKITDIKPMSE